MVDGQVDLEGRVAGIFRVGEPLHDVLERDQRRLGIGLVAADIDDLLVERDRLQIEGIGDLVAARMQRDIGVGGRDRVGIFVGLIVAEGRHQHRAARPNRIGMLALDLVELLGGAAPSRPS